MYTKRPAQTLLCGAMGEGAGGPHAPSCFSVRSLVASSEDRERLPRGLPEMILTRSLLFIRLYLFSDRLTNCGERRRAGQEGGMGGQSGRVGQNYLGFKFSQIGLHQADKTNHAFVPTLLWTLLWGPRAEHFCYKETLGHYSCRGRRHLLPLLI